jgi:GT2 family glycosyltransferase
VAHGASIPLTRPAAHVCHVDLGGELPAIAGRPGDVPVWLYLWRDGVPVARRIVRPRELPLTAAQAAELRAEAPPAPPTAVTSDTAAVSVVVCTRERPAALARCLAALTVLDPAPGEILVVDNAPTSDAARDVAAAWPGVRYLVEPRPGLDRARNAGLAAARGAFVAYTDDDVEVPRDWLGRLIACFAEPDVVAATGLVVPAELDTDAQRVFEEHLGGLDRGYVPRRFDATWFARHRRGGAPVWHVGAGANMAFRRAALEATGGFDERLDAGAAGCSGDSELWYRLLAAGGVCTYTPAAVVYHHHRRTVAELRRQVHDYMRGHVAALLVQFERHRHWGNVYRLAVKLPAYYARQLVVGALRGFPLESRIVLGGVTGVVAGLRYYAGSRGDAP